MYVGISCTCTANTHIPNTIHVAVNPEIINFKSTFRFTETRVHKLPTRTLLQLHVLSRTNVIFRREEKVEDLGQFHSSQIFSSSVAIVHV